MEFLESLAYHFTQLIMLLLSQGFLVLFLYLVEFLLEPELLAFRLNAQASEQGALVKLEEDLRVSDVSFLELGDALDEADVLEQLLDVLMGQVLLGFLFLLLLDLLLLVVDVLFLDEALEDHLVLGDLLGQLFLDVIEVLVFVEYVPQLPASDLLLANQVQDLLDVLLVRQVLNDQRPCLGPVLQGEVLLALLLAADHAHDALLVEHGSHAHGGEAAFVDVLEVANTFDAAVFPELGRVLVHVDAPEPLVDAHVLHLVVGVHQGLCVVNGSLHITLVLKEMSLKLGHVKFEFRKLVGEVLSLLFAFFREELLKQSFHLVLGGVVELHVDVRAAWSQQSGVQLLSVVGGHHQDASFLGPDTVQGIQQAGESDLLSHLLVLLHGGSLHEDGVDVLEQDDRPKGSVVQQTVN